MRAVSGQAMAGSLGVQLADLSGRTALVGTRGLVVVPVVAD